MLAWSSARLRARLPAMKPAALLPIPKGDFTLPDATEVSKLLRDYAQPLLYIDPAGPADMETMRTAMGLAMICWNLPVYEAVGSPLYAQGMRTLEAVSAQVPAAVSACLKKLITERKTKFASHPFLATVEVVGDRPRSATIAAEARRPRVPASS
jgi:hypothetical protein